MMFEKVRSKVLEVLIGSSNWHGINHIDRVFNTALKFADNEGGNRDIIGVATLLHDVDDCKLFGEESGKNLPNARRIMNECEIAPDVQNAVIDIIRTMGFSNALSGIRPTTLEGKIVSDADMCDNGVAGIIRVAEVGTAVRRKFFDRNLWPRLDEELTLENYKDMKKSTTINHLFEKTLRLRDYMMTESGKIQQIDNNYYILLFLRQYFTENNAPEWIEFLDKYLASHALDAWKK